VCKGLLGGHCSLFSKKLTLFDSEMGKKCPKRNVLFDSLCSLLSYFPLFDYLLSFQYIELCEVI